MTRGAGPVVIVGAGLSGLAAAVRLAINRIPVTVLEQKPVPGGRAYSYTDAATGEKVDNGQHAMIAGYARTLAFLDTIGTRHLLYVQPRPVLPFHHPGRGFQTMAFPRLPSPVHLLAGILSTGLLASADKVDLLEAGFFLWRNDPDYMDHLADCTISEWLDDIGQSPECRRSFWEPLAVSIMNEETSTASALLFVRTLRTAFLGHHSNAALVLPAAGLSDLFAEPAARFIGSRGGIIRCQVDVDAVRFTNGKAAGVETRTGEHIPASAVILAVPPHKLHPLLHDPPVDLRLPVADALSWSPIVSVHLWFDEDVMPGAVLGLIGRRVQWVFNKRKLIPGDRQGGHLSAVISAAHAFVGLSSEVLVTLALEDLRSVFGARMPAPSHSVVIREKRATYSSSPARERLRPGNVTSVPGLYLAGDWTATGYPATIEGAIVSGEACADHILRLS